MYPRTFDQYFDFSSIIFDSLRRLKCDMINKKKILEIEHVRSQSWSFHFDQRRSFPSINISIFDLVFESQIIIQISIYLLQLDIKFSILISSLFHLSFLNFFNEIRSIQIDSYSIRSQKDFDVRRRSSRIYISIKHIKKKI